MLHNVSFVISVTLVGVLLPFVLAAQSSWEPGSVRGMVSDAEEQPLYGITILVEETRSGTVTGKNGEFEIDNLEPGEYTITVSGVGYKPVSYSVTVEDDSVTRLEIILDDDIRELGSLVVYGKSDAGIKREEAFTVSSFSTQPVQNASSNLDEVLISNPGVHIRKEGGLGSRFNLSLNGLSGRQVRIFLDGLPMENYGNSMSINNLPVNLVERVEVYKGVVPVYLGGDALGGAVNLVTRQAPSRYLDASYSAGSFNTHKIALDGQWVDSSSGFVLKANGFYNYSDNDYSIDVRIPDPETGIYGEEQRVRRFHDAYESRMVKAEAGFRGLVFADELMAGISFSDNRDEVQHGMSMDRVFGRVYTHSNSTIGSLTYRKEFENLQVKGFASYLENRSGVVDTSAVSYNWQGEYTPKNNRNIAESGWQKTLFRYNDRAFQTNVNITYLPDNRQTLTLNYTQTYINRKGDDPASRHPVAFENPNSLDKKVFSGSYRLNLFDDRWSTTAFSKLYLFNSETADVDWDGTVSEYSNTLFKPGYGIASTVRILEGLRFKTSYEKTYRFPDGYEMFGDGLLLLPNPELTPESSHNLNAGLLFDRIFGHHRIMSEANVFRRDAQHLIRVEATGLTAQYVNQRNVLSSGVEAGMRYEYKRFFFADANITFQNIVNNSRYENGRLSYVYGDRIPNIPYLMSSQSIGFKVDDLVGEGDRFTLTWRGNFVEEYYLKWPSQGASDNKHIIPRQYIHSAELGYSFRNGRYNVTLESTNLTDARAYDHFRLQKPGRALWAKFRYHFH